MSTIKVDDELKMELTRIQSMYQDGSLSYNDVVWRAVRLGALAPLLIRYINSKIDNWNPYEVLSWFYEKQRGPMDKYLVEAYASLIEDMEKDLGE